MLRVIGRQWWWEVEYLSDRPYQRFRTANKILIPTGRLAGVALETRDVIHSFWIPSLARNTDPIPGRINRSGCLRGARGGSTAINAPNFSGLQHAHMAMKVVAVRPEEFDR
jgi:cytochrome c oxidase subunit 2